MYFTVILLAALGLYALKGERTVLTCERKDGVVHARVETSNLLGTSKLDISPGELLAADLEES